jgi:hypothetical protein
MKRIFFLLVLLSLLSLSPIGVAEEWSYSVALEVGDSFEFEHTRSLDVVKNGSILANVSEVFVANVTVDAIDLVNATDDEFGNYTEMVISSSVAVGNETLNATESLFEVVFLNQALGFGEDILMAEISNDSLEFAELGEYVYFLEDNASLPQQFVADVEELNFSNYLAFSDFGEFELGLNDSYEGGYSLGYANGTFSLLVNESYFFAENNASLDIFVDLEVDINASLVVKHLRSVSLAIGNDSLSFEDSFVEYVAPVVVESSAVESSSVETSEEEAANFVLFAIPLALIPLLRRKN